MEADSGIVIVQLAGQVVERMVLTPGEHTIGRAPDNRLPLAHPEVGRWHAVIRVTANDVFLEDLGSSKRTLLGDARLSPHQPYRLSSGESWFIGPFLLTYRQRRQTQLDHKQDLRTLLATEYWPEPRAIALEQMAKRKAEELPPVETPVSRYLHEIPGIYQDEEGFLGRYLKIFETIWEPLEYRQDHIAMYFDPRTCPARALDWLASWLGFPLEPGLPEDRRRVMLHEATWLLRWRGTHYGLSRLLELCTGSVPDIRLDPTETHVLVLRLPLPADPEVSPELVERLIETHKPAHCAYRLEWLS